MWRRGWGSSKILNIILRKCPKILSENNFHIVIVKPANIF